MALDDKTAPFSYHSVIHIEVVPANTNRGHIRNFPVVPEFHSISKFTFISVKVHISNWQNSKPTRSAFLGSKFLSSQSFSRNRALHLIKFLLQILILHLAHLSLHSMYFIFSRGSCTCDFISWANGPEMLTDATYCEAAS